MAEKVGFAQPLINILTSQGFGLPVGFLPQADLRRMTAPGYSDSTDTDAVRRQLLDAARNPSTSLWFSFNATPVSRVLHTFHLPTLSDERVKEVASLYSDGVMANLLEQGPMRIQSEVLLLPLNITATAMALHELGIEQFPLFKQLHQDQKRLFLTEVARAQRSYYKDKPEVQHSIDDFINKLNEKVGETPSEQKG